MRGILTFSNQTRKKGILTLQLSTEHEKIVKQGVQHITMMMGILGDSADRVNENIFIYILKSFYL